MFIVYLSLLENMDQKESQISLYGVQRELRQVATRCFAYSEGAGQVFTEWVQHTQGIWAKSRSWS